MFKTIRTPQKRQVTQLVEDFKGGTAVIAITQHWGKYVARSQTTLYYLDRLPVAWGGEGFILTKVERPTDPEQDEAHQCHYSNDQDFGCSCRGFTVHGCCKHLSALRQLREDGRI